MSEKIGQVVLDDTYYPGKDLYTDGAIEDGDRRAQKLADPVSFFTYQRKYLKLASVHRRRKCPGDRLRLRRSDWRTVQEGKERDLHRTVTQEKPDQCQQT